MDKKQSVLLDNDEKELFRCKQELHKSKVGAALIKHKRSVFLQEE